MFTVKPEEDVAYIPVALGNAATNSQASFGDTVVSASASLLLLQTA